MTSPSDELRQAAAHIREVAGKVSLGPWSTYDVSGELIIGADGAQILDVYEGYGNTAVAAYITLWDPDVAELVAKMLDEADAAIAAASRQGIAGLTTGLRGALADLSRAINAKAGAA